MDKPKAVLADDEMHIQKLLELIISLSGFEIAAKVNNGNEAIEAYQRLKPDILFLDVNMPFKTGIEALKEIMAIDGDAFVIMLTSVSDMETVKECLNIGAAYYIRKDTPVNEMAEMIKRLWQEWTEGDQNSDE